MEILYGSEGGECRYENNAGGFAFEKTDRDGHQAESEDNLIGKGSFKRVGP